MKIEALLEELQAEMKVLKKQLEAAKPQLEVVGSDSAVASRSQAMEDLLTERQKKIISAGGSPLHTSAVGLSTGPFMTLAFSYVYWWHPWGFKALAGSRLEEAEQEFNTLAGFYLLRSFHSFSLLDIENLFHLYGYGGSGFHWQKEQYEDVFPEKVYENPDVSAEILLGVGTEISIPLLGGVRITPEIGYKAEFFFSRYQNSDDWKATKEIHGEDRPESDFSLVLNFNFDFYFYFK